MKLKTKFHGTLAFALDREGVAIMRLLQRHAPLLQLVGKTEDNRSFVVSLGHIELPHHDAS